MARHLSAWYLRAHPQCDQGLVQDQMALIADGLLVAYADYLAMARKN